MFKHGNDNVQSTISPSPSSSASASAPHETFANGITQGSTPTFSVGGGGGGMDAANQYAGGQQDHHGSHHVNYVGTPASGYATSVVGSASSTNLEAGSYGVHPSYYMSPQNTHPDSSAAPSLASGGPSRPPSSSASVTTSSFRALPSHVQSSSLGRGKDNTAGAPPGSSGSGSNGETGSGSASGSGSPAGSVTSGDSGHTAAAAHHFQLRHHNQQQTSQQEEPAARHSGPSVFRQPQSLSSPSLFDVPAGYRTTRSASDKLHSLNASSSTIVANANASDVSVPNPEQTFSYHRPVSSASSSNTAASSFPPSLLGSGLGPALEHHASTHMSNDGGRFLHTRNASSSSLASSASSAPDTSPSLTPLSLSQFQQQQQQQSSSYQTQKQVQHVQQQMPQDRLQQSRPRTPLSVSTTPSFAQHFGPQTPISPYDEFKQPLQGPQYQQSPQAQSPHVPFTPQPGAEMAHSPQQGMFPQHQHYQQQHTPSRHPLHLQTGLTPGFNEMQAYSPTSASPAGPSSPSVRSPGTSTTLTWMPTSGRAPRPTRRQYHQSQDMTQQVQSRSQDGSESHFVVPAPPSSAPAGTTSFDLSRDDQQSFNPQSVNYSKLEPPDPFKSRNVLSTPVSALSTNPSSASHSRSPSVSSTAGYTSLGPLSASTSSSASSSFGDLSNAGSTPRRSMRLSNLDRRAMCHYAEAHPRVKHEHIGQMFGVERSTVSKILKQKSKWFAVLDDNTLPASSNIDKKAREPRAIVKNKVGRHPLMEDKLMEWGKQQTENGRILTDELVREKALEIAGVLNIELAQFKASAGWMENFKERSGYRSGKFSLLTPSFLSEDDLLQYEDNDEDEDYDETVMEGAREHEALASSANFTTSSHSSTTAPTSSSNDASNILVGVDAGPSHSPTSTRQALQPAALWKSPAGMRGHRRGGMSSMSSSTVSLPGLAEEDEIGQSELEQSGGSSSIDLRSAATSFSGPSLQPYSQTPDGTHFRQQPSSHSSDSSAFPSRLSSTESETSHPSLQYTHVPDRTAVQSSTPTQGAVDNASQNSGDQERPTLGMDPHAPFNIRLQQARLSFSDSLDPNAEQYMYPRPFFQQPHSPMPLQSPGLPERPVAFTAIDQGNSHRSENMLSDNAARAIESFGRSRNYSAPNVSGQAYIHPQNTEAVPSRLGRSDYRPDFHFTQLSNEQSNPDHMQYKVPLQRSHTDPMPNHLSLSMQQAGLYSQAHQGDVIVPGAMSEVNDMSGAMQIDSTYQQQYGHYDLGARDHSSHMQQQQLQAYHQQQQHMQQSQQAFTTTSQPRRATISIVGQPSALPSVSNSTNVSYAHGPSYSTSAVTTPVYANFGASDSSLSRSSERPTLNEAYMSLKKVVDFLHVDGEAARPLAVPSQITAIESLLAQMKQAQLSNPPNLTPPNST